MKKNFIIGSFFILSTLFADNSLGTPLSSYLLKPQQETKSYNKNVDNPPKAISQYSKQKFRKDDHRYDKRYNNFNYDRDGYYDNEGYYYGYYDTTGYFYNNIFFTYNSRYSYYDRDHLRGHFRPSYQHHRVYEYHVVNDWNRVHCYREPNSIVYGYYYDRPSYNTHYRSSYYNNSTRYSRDNARMHTNRNMSRNTNRNIYRRDTHQRENYYRNNNHRYDNHQNNNYRNQNNNNHNSYRNRNEHRSDTRMRTRNSSDSHRITTHQNHNYGNTSNQHSTAHMQLSR